MFDNESSNRDNDAVLDRGDIEDDGMSKWFRGIMGWCAVQWCGNASAPGSMECELDSCRKHGVEESALD